MKLRLPKIYLRDLFWLTIVVALVVALQIEKRRTLEQGEWLNQKFNEFHESNNDWVRSQREQLEKKEKELGDSWRKLRERENRIDAEEARAREHKSQ